MQGCKGWKYAYTGLFFFLGWQIKLMNTWWAGRSCSSITGKNQRKCCFMSQTREKSQMAGRGNSPCSGVSVSDNPELRASRAREEQRSHMVSTPPEKKTLLASPWPPTEGRTNRERNKKKKKREESQSQKSQSFPTFLSTCHTDSRQARQTAAHYAWLLNKSWCIFMSQSQLMC